MGTILVPVDFSDYSLSAVEYAAAIAKKINSGILLYHGYHVVTETDYAPISASYVGLQIENQQHLWEERMAELKSRLANEQYDNGSGPLAVNSTVKMGLVVDDVAEMAEDPNIELVVMGTKGATGLERALFGSVTVAVLDKISCPVLAVPKGAKFKGFEQIVYATDFDDKDIEVIDDLLEFAAYFDSHITCLHINTDLAHMTDDKAEIDVLRETYWFTPINRLDFALKRDESVPKGIDHYLQEHDTQLLAVLRQSHSFWERLLARSVSKNLAYHSEVPLLILKK